MPFTQTTTLAPYGTIPVAVAKTCQLTWYCQFQNIHPRTVGYTVIADLITEGAAGLTAVSRRAGSAPR